MKKILLLALLLSGCATHSGVIQDGKDSFIVMVSGGSGFASAGQLRIDAYKEASEYCRTQEKQLETLSDKTIQAGVLASTSEAELKFKCINK